MSYVIGVDPGKMTGVAVWGDHEERIINAWQCTGDEYVDWARGFMLGSKQMGRHVYWCVERFTINARTVRSARTDENWSIEQIGWTRHEARHLGQDFRLQDPASAKKLAPNDKLREAGIYVKGRDHANDAIRHVILGRAELFRVPPVWV